MSKPDLQGIVRKGLDDPSILGRLACFLYDDESVVQEHRDGRKLFVFWREQIGHWRCTIFNSEDVENNDTALAQVDIYADGTVRVEVWSPCSITVSPTEDVLSLTRYHSD
jgi:hypothetical protein